MPVLWARPADSTLKKRLSLRWAQSEASGICVVRILSTSETAKARELFPTLMGLGCFYLTSLSVD